MANKKKTLKQSAAPRPAIKPPMTNADDKENSFLLNSVPDLAMRARLQQAISGGYDFADALHNVYLDFGYPSTLGFSNYWNMYKRFGIANSIIDKPVDVTWMTPPVIEGSDKLVKEIEDLVKVHKIWDRLKGLDIRQRIGRYGALFMRVRDGKKPSEPIEGKGGGAGFLVEIIPLNETQLTITKTQGDPMKDDFGKPTMYTFNGSATGGHGSSGNQTFEIHPDRIIISAEGADDGGIYGTPELEAPYNSLMDLRKIIGAGGEGFYRNAAQSLVHQLKDGSQTISDPALLEEFKEQSDDFVRNRMRRTLFVPGLETEALQSSLSNPKEFFMNALNDVSAASGIPATILIGQQTGRLASSEDSKHMLSLGNSRRETFLSGMVMDVLEWLMLHGVLGSGDFIVEWDDLLEQSDEERLGNAFKMSDINHKQYSSGGSAAFTSEEIREQAGYEPIAEIEAEGEELPEGEEDDDNTDD